MCSGQGMTPPARFEDRCLDATGPRAPADRGTPLPPVARVLASDPCGEGLPATAGPAGADRRPLGSRPPDVDRRHGRPEGDGLRVFSPGG